MKKKIAIATGDPRNFSDSIRSYIATNYEYVVVSDNWMFWDKNKDTCDSLAKSLKDKNSKLNVYIYRPYSHYSNYYHDVDFGLEYVIRAVNARSEDNPQVIAMDLTYQIDSLNPMWSNYNVKYICDRIESANNLYSGVFIDGGATYFNSSLTYWFQAKEDLQVMEDSGLLYVLPSRVVISGLKSTYNARYGYGIKPVQVYYTKDGVDIYDYSTCWHWQRQIGGFSGVNVGEFVKVLYPTKAVLPSAYLPENQPQYEKAIVEFFRGLRGLLDERYGIIANIGGADPKQCLSIVKYLTWLHIEGELLAATSKNVCRESEIFSCQI